MRRPSLVIAVCSVLCAPLAAAAQCVKSTSPDYSASVSPLQEAAQRLRESIQAMAQQPAGERRNQAAAQARTASR